MFKNFLELLERIAVALETIAKIEYTPKSIDHEVNAIEAEETEDAEVLATRKEASELLTENPTKQMWAEDNLTNDQLESLE